jgi:hypothetical protein
MKIVGEQPLLTQPSLHFPNIHFRQRTVLPLLVTVILAMPTLLKTARDDSTYCNTASNWTYFEAHPYKGERRRVLELNDIYLFLRPSATIRRERTEFSYSNRHWAGYHTLLNSRWHGLGFYGEQWLRRSPGWLSDRHRHNANSHGHNHRYTRRTRRGLRTTLIVALLIFSSIAILRIPNAHAQPFP